MQVDRDRNRNCVHDHRTTLPLPADRVAATPHGHQPSVRFFGSHRQDVALAAIVLIAIALMLVPVPTFVVDLLLASNLALGLIMLSSVVLLPDPLRFSAFPSLLIIATLIRLAAGVSTTRLILGAADGGAVVRAFGNMVFADSVVVGLVVFALITVIQFVVIARGAERIAEVTARFMLDALPGKQQAIDADVRAGAIDRQEASRRRARLATESQFFGSMDGAMKFVKGDVIATVVVVVINLIGGMIVGLGQNGLSLGEAAATYSVLSIGEGLAAQVPALMAAAAAGILVARRARELAVANDDGALGRDLFGQLGAMPAALIVSGGVLALLALLPGMPTMPFAVLAAVCGLAVFGRQLWQPRQRDVAHTEQLWEGVAVPTTPAVSALPWPTAATIDDDAVWLALGDGVASALTTSTLPQALQSLADARNRVSSRLGFALPPWIAIAPATTSPATLPTMSLASDELCLVWRGVARSWQRVATAAHTAGPSSDAGATAAPSHVAIAAAAEHAMLECAYAVISTDIVRGWCMTYAASPTRATQVAEVIPSVISYAALTDVLRDLAREHVGIGDFEAILRAIATAPVAQRSSIALVARIRLALADQITQSVAVGQQIAAWHIDPLAEDAVRSAIVTRGEAEYLALAPDLAHALLMATKHAVAAGGATRQASPTTIVVPSDIRRHVRDLLYGELPRVAVVAHNELRPGAIVVPRGQISI